jgi:hypothetical protein
MVATISDADRPRSCVGCGASYTISEFLHSCPSYFEGPEDYQQGCATHCLSCWLQCGPDPHDVFEGNVLREFGHLLGPSRKDPTPVHLAIMPIARATLESLIRVVGAEAVLYPPGEINFDRLNIRPNDPNSKSLAEVASASSRVDVATISNHATIAFTVRFDWERIFSTGHAGHLEFIRSLSEIADNRCLNLIRFRLCRLDPIDSLPGHAGQVDSNHMMAGAILYNALKQEGRIVGGAAFTHFITRGLGLPIGEIGAIEFLQDYGEVSQFAQRALSLYAALLEADSPSAKFVQAISLLEYLAEPRKYLKYHKVKQLVAGFLAQDETHRRHLMERFAQLMGGVGEEIGYRTRIVHIGDRLDELVPDNEARLALFLELDGYIRPMLDHMISHSAWEFEEYQKIRVSSGSLKLSHLG